MKILKLHKDIIEQHYSTRYVSKNSIIKFESKQHKH